MLTYFAVRRHALSLINPRATYTRNVVLGRQALSGADLRGAAKRFGAGYARQRGVAIDAWESAGGTHIAVEHGRRELAVQVRTDDYGSAVYDIGEGNRYVPYTRARCRKV